MRYPPCPISISERTAIEHLSESLGLPESRRAVQYLAEFLSALKSLNYENVSKILRASEHRDAASLLRTPEMLVEDYFRFGSGGTCFSLTYLAWKMLSCVGVPAGIVMGDRSYGTNTHCALFADADDRPWLLDIGYLVYQPVRVDSAETTSVQTELNVFEIVPTADGRLEAYTTFRGQRKYRFTLTREPVSDAEFRAHWERTFEFDMMQYPVVTRIVGERQLYLQGTRFQIRTALETEKRELEPAAIPGVVEEHFQMDAGLTERAVALTLLEEV